MKTAKLGDYLLWKGELSKVIGEMPAKAIIIEILENQKCPHCNGDLGQNKYTSLSEADYFRKTLKAFKLSEQNEPIRALNSL